MIISLSLLKEHINLSKFSTQKIEEAFLKIGLEVESSINYFELQDYLKIGYIKELRKHPDADKLNVCTVLINNEETEIICGAANVRKDAYVVVAIKGAKLPNGLVIKPTKIRGLHSNGMICSLSELGIEEKHQSEENKKGIYIFPDKPNLDVNPLELLGLLDIIWNLSIPSNRPDLFSSFNLAREIGQFLDIKVVSNEMKFLTKPLDDKLIQIRTKHCIAYSYLILKNVKITNSPSKVVNLLRSVNIRSINNIVDLTNLAMLETGHPTHAYDYDEIKSGLEVRVETENTKTELLNDEIVDAINSVVIAKGPNICCLGGIIGAKYSSIVDSTKNIFLEIAIWDPKITRQTITSKNINTQAGNLFSKNISQNSLFCVASKIKELANKYFDLDLAFDCFYTNTEEQKEPQKFKLEKSFIESLIGQKFETSRILSILNIFADAIQNNDTYEVAIPWWRSDIQTNQDIIFELTKHVNLNSINAKPPILPDDENLNTKFKQKIRLKELLVANKISEVITYSLIDKDVACALKWNYPSYNLIETLKPISSTRTTMRPSLAFSLLEVLSHNEKNNVFKQSFFEESNIYLEGLSESWLGLLLHDQFITDYDENTIGGIEFVKSICQNIFTTLGIHYDYIKYEISPTKKLYMNTYSNINVFYKNIIIGSITTLNHEAKKSFNIFHNYWYLELNLSTIHTLPRNKLFLNSENKYQCIHKDITLICETDSIIHDLLQCIKKLPNIFDCKLKYVYEKPDKAFAITLTMSLNFYQEYSSNDMANIFNLIEIEVLNKFNAKLNKKLF